MSGAVLQDSVSAICAPMLRQFLKLRRERALVGPVSPRHRRRADSERENVHGEQRNRAAAHLGTDGHARLRPVVGPPARRRRIAKARECTSSPMTRSWLHSEAAQQRNQNRHAARLDRRARPKARAKRFVDNPVAHLELVRLSDVSQYFAFVRAPPLHPSLATGEEVNVADCEAKQTRTSAIWTSSCGAAAWAV
jgi:hypothetical protein